METTDITALGLKNKDFAAITNTFKSRPIIKRAVIFGSRAKNSHSLYSDIDIALYGDMDAFEVEAIKCELDELPTVYKFDVVVYELLKNHALKQHIDRVGVVIYETESISRIKSKDEIRDDDKIGGGVEE